MDIIHGKVWKFGDNVDTDLIIPARYLNMTDPEELAAHLFEPIKGENFNEIVGESDIVIGGDNFGCGSSREHAPIALKASGVACVVAKTFARIFYRNSFNIGLPLIIQPEAAEDIQDGEILNINLGEGKIKNQTTSKEYSFPALEGMMIKLLENKGLISYILNEGYDSSEKRESSG
ncbi:3-isopropylmalate dehydratase small subunit [candidate division WOR-3 bacterium]|nr:3-isopropylmalate dehydratase small subunit [candidate division WOR-3 bacterium]